MSVTSVLLAGALASSLAGCVTTGRAERDADRTAYEIVRQKQQAALGHAEEFTIETPQETLRRRLMLDQHLPAAGLASLGRAYLPPVPKQPGGVSEGRQPPGEAQLVGTRPARVRGVHTETFATDLFLLDIGANPEARPVSPPPPPADAARRELGDLPQRPLGPPAPEAYAQPLHISLVDALQIGARNSRDYQTQKENVFINALALDLERDRFEFRFSGLVDADIRTDLSGPDDVTGVVVSPQLGVNKLFKQGALLTSRIGLDIAKLLSGDRSSSLGLFADASVTIPLLRGSGKEVVTEPLHQAERDAIYSIWQFERFKQGYAISVVREYYNVLADLDAIANSEANYDRLRENSRRSRALAREGQLPEVQVGQVLQNELRARERLMLSRQRYESRLESFKLLLGLPADAYVVLDPGELERLAPIADRVLEGLGIGINDWMPEDEVPAEPPAPAPVPDPAPDNGTTGAETVSLAVTVPVEFQPPEQIPAEPEVPGREEFEQPPDPPEEPPTPEEIERAQREVLDVAGLVERLPPELPFIDPQGEMEQAAIRVALQNRLDLAIAFGSVTDAQRRTVLAADGLRPGLDISGDAAIGARRGVFSGGADDAQLRFDQGRYGLGATLNLPIERTAERNAYRIALINLERAVRSAQELEDRVKLDVLDSLRRIQVASESLQVQAIAILVAQRRVDAANMLFEVGRGQARDLTEAEDALVTAQNQFTQALISFRMAELELQRDLGVLEVDSDGLYRELPLPIP